MNQENPASERAMTVFERMWRRGDPWQAERSQYDQASYARQLALLMGRRYDRALELGCGAGSFTRRLAGIAGRVVAIDVAPSAIALARERSTDGRIDYRVADAVSYDARAEGPWDLIVISETIYAIASLYSFHELTVLATSLYDATAAHGQLLMANTIWEKDVLARPAAIRTYRDLFVNVGYELEAEEVFAGKKDGVDLEALISLLAKR